MKRKHVCSWVVVSLMSVASLGYSCPDFGVALKVAGKDFASLPIRVRGNSISVTAPDKKIYTFSYLGSLTKGKWCYRLDDPSKLNTAIPKPICQKKHGEKLVVELKNGNGALVAKVGLEGKVSPTLAGTNFTGVLLRIAKMDAEGNSEQPWLRFVYSFETTGPDGVTFQVNERSALEKELKELGIDPKDGLDYTIAHQMYGDLFENRDSGIVDSWKIHGNVLVNKSEHPYIYAKGIAKAESSDAELDGKYWRTTPGSSGCHAELEEVKPFRK